MDCGLAISFNGLGITVSRGNNAPKEMRTNTIKNQYKLFRTNGTLAGYALLANRCFGGTQI